MDAPLVPMRPTDARVEVGSVDWLFSPDWPGERLIARRRQDGVRLTDVAGEPVGGRDELCRMLGSAIGAEEATVDGVWADHPGRLGRDSGGAFVAADLLELAGDSLLDVPFLERHRLLESVVEQSVGVRVSPVVKHPISGWLSGWREQGFDHYLARHQNSRYHPGEEAEDWLRIPIVAPAPPGVMQRVLGVGRERGRRSIRD